MTVNNMSNNPMEYVVARNIDGELWYWGSWEVFEDAAKAAAEMNGIVIPLEEIK